MGTKERRERERQDVRQKIKDAARELFSTKGYEAVTMREIAERIEYSATAIYLHFPDKESLVKELCEEDFLSFAKEFQHAAAIPDPVERVKAIGVRYIQFGVTYPHHYRLMFMSQRPSADPCDAQAAGQGDPDRDAYAMLLTTVQSCVDAGCMRKEFQDVHLVAQTLWAAVHGVVALHLSFSCDKFIALRPPLELGRAAMDSVFRGMVNESALASFKRQPQVSTTEE